MTEVLNTSLRKRTNIKTKIQSTDHSSYSRSIDIFRDDINLRKDYLKERMNNPYWIPNRNRDIFLIKGIYRDKKELIRNRQQSVQNGIRSLSNQQSFENLDENHNNTINPVKKAGVYVTEQTFNNSNIKTSESGDTLPIIANKYKPKKWNSVLSSPVKSLNPFSKKFSEISNLKFESVKGYLDKTKHICELKNSIRLKQERIERLEESYKYELGALRESIGSMIISKEKYENDFNNKYLDYQKFIKQEKEREEFNLHILYDKKFLLETKAKQLETRINKFKEKISQLKEYKVFIHMVSRKKIYLTSSDRKKKSKDNIKKRMSIFSNEPLDSYEFILKNTKKISDIYKEPSELIDDIRLLEQQNINILANLNEYSKMSRFLLSDIARLENEVKMDNRISETDIKSNEEILLSLKEKNERLKEKKEEYLKNHKNNITSSAKQKIFHSQIIGKIVLIVQKCNGINISNINYHGNDQIEMMKFLERAYDYLYLRYLDYKNEIPDCVKTVEKDLETERKKKIAEESRQYLQLKKVMLTKKVEEKISKVNLKPTRNTYEFRNMPLPKLKEKKQISVKSSEPILQDLLHYDTEEFI